MRECLQGVLTSVTNDGISDSNGTGRERNVKETGNVSQGS